MTQTNLEPLEILSSLGIYGTPMVTPVQGGFDMAMWKVEHEGQTYALRVFRPGEQKNCERERVVMAAALAAGLPVPEVCAAGVWQDRPALLISWLPGRTVADELRARPWRAWRLGIAFGRMQVAIHAVPAPDLLRQLPDPGITWKDERTGVARSLPPSDFWKGGFAAPGLSSVQSPDRWQADHRDCGLDGCACRRPTSRRRASCALIPWHASRFFSGFVCASLIWPGALGINARADI